MTQARVTRCLPALGALTALIMATRQDWLKRLDLRAVELAGSRRTPGAVTAARTASAAAEPVVAAALLAAATVTALGRRRDSAGWQAWLVPAGAVLTGAAARHRLAQLVARPRPPAALWLAKPTGSSLPSRHTCLAALTAGACAQALGADRTASQGAALLASAGVGAGRVCLGVHWPSDVVAGWLFAAAWLDLATGGVA